MIWEGDRTAPIVVLGAARSGTKFLRDILAAGKGTRAVPYDVNYVWRYGFEAMPHDRLDPELQTDKQRRFISRALSDIARIKPSEVLIEKTVSNTLRVPYVAAALPNVRFVHLIRDGRSVTESAMRLWQAPPDWSALQRKLRGMPLANLGYVAWFGWNFATGIASGRKGGKVWGPRYPGIDEDVARLSLAEVCALQWRHSVETARADLRLLPANRVFEVRYEALVNSEAPIIALAEALDLPDVEAISATWRAQVKHDAVDKWSSMTVSDRTGAAAHLRPLLSELGYHSND